MKLMMSILLAAAMSTAVLAQSQGSSSQSDQSNQNNQGQSASTSSTSTGSQNQQTMQGKVSKDAKTFTNDKNNKSYNVSNPDALKGYEGQDVAVIVGVDPDTNTIHIIQLAPQ